MPTPRAGAAVVVLGKQILVVGGVGEDQSPLKVVEMYNTEEGRWRKRSALREALMGLSITLRGTPARCVVKRDLIRHPARLLMSPPRWPWSSLWAVTSTFVLLHSVAADKQSQCSAQRCLRQHLLEHR